jgi:hypothetical protein
MRSKPAVPWHPVYVSVAATPDVHIFLEYILYQPKGQSVTRNRQRAAYNHPCSYRWYSGPGSAFEMPSYPITVHTSGWCIAPRSRGHRGL